MIEQSVEIPMHSGTAPGLLIRPDHDGPFPGVIHLTDAGGTRPSHITMASQLAEKGYAVLLPNLFYRTGGKPAFQRPPEVSREVMMAQLAKVVASFTPEVVEADGNCFVDFLLNQDSVSKSAIGVVGYCFSGSISLRIAALRPHNVAAAASFHGGELWIDSPNSPHLVLPQVKGHLYFGHADKDPYMPAESIVKFDQALRDWGGTYESEVYADAFHSWTVLDSPVYNAAQAERAFDKLTSLFAETLE